MCNKSRIEKDFTCYNLKNGFYKARYQTQEEEFERVLKLISTYSAKHTIAILLSTNFEVNKWRRG